ncbi:LuxR C-terminal-related transcriptional regulator [Solicola sp. PLA-1-18]|uniref:LuxR C-terminal-related transcriptional regulator n=1 Tax=Solicola sp. PLA-1-18 TaxID=3380532 RepID=UPI003B8102C8
MTGVSVVTWNPRRFRQAVARTKLTHVQLAAIAGLPAASVGAFGRGVAAPTPAGLVSLAAALRVTTTDLAPMSEHPSLHELRWHTGHSVTSLAQVLGFSAGQVGAVMGGRAPMTNPDRWARALKVDLKQLEAARRVVPRRPTAPPPPPPTERTHAVECDPWSGGVATLSRALARPLSPRQQQVLRLLCTDATVDQIAAQLELTMATTRTHIRLLYDRLGPDAHTRAAARALVVKAIPDPDLRRTAVSNALSDLLGPGRLEVMSRLHDGQTVVQISQALGVSTNTVYGRVRHVHRLLGVHTRAEALTVLFGGPTP